LAVTSGWRDPRGAGRLPDPFWPSRERSPVMHVNLLAVSRTRCTDPEWCCWAGKLYSGWMRRAIVGTSCLRDQTIETTVIVSPNFAKVASVSKAVQIVNQQQDSFSLRILMEDWVDESTCGKQSLDPRLVAKSPKGMSAKQPVIIITGRPLKEGYFCNEHRNCFLISTAVQEATYPTRPLHLYVAYNLINCLPLFPLAIPQRLKLQSEVVHENETIGCLNDYCQTIGDMWKSMLNAHMCPACKADLVAAGLRERYLESIEKVLERIKRLARAYDKTRRPDLFICHSFKDRPFAEQLAIDIKEAGFKSWFAEFEMQVGDSLIDKIHQAIKRSALFAVVLSPDSVNSSWCRHELKNAMAREVRQKNKVFVLPIVYKKCRMPSFLKEKVWLEMGGRRYREGLAMIIERLREMEEAQ
jgi:hypothetical protein